MPSPATPAQRANLIALTAVLSTAAGTIAHQRSVSISDVSSLTEPRVFAAGETRWTVTPSRPDDGGSAVYQCEQNTARRPSATLPFTLTRATITSNDLLVGFGYVHGLRADRPLAATDPPNNLILAAINPDGAVVAERSIARSTIYSGTTPLPTADAVIATPQAGRVIVTATDWPDEARARVRGYIFDGSSKTWLDPITPPQPASTADVRSRLLTTTSIPDSPVILTHWLITESGTDPSSLKRCGDLIIVTDAAGQELWRFERPDGLPNHRRPITEIERDARSLVSVASRQFAIHDPTAPEKQRTFAIGGDDSAPQVIEQPSTGRSPTPPSK